MKVAIVCGAGILSGKERMALELGDGLRAERMEVHFITSRWGSGELAKRSEIAGFPTVRMWLGFISATMRLDCIWMTVDQMRRWPALLLSYRRFLKTFRPDKVIHTNWQHTLLLWPFLRRVRDLYWVHELSPNKPQYRYFFGKLSKRIGCFVAVSQAAARSLIALGLPTKKIHVVHNGISDPAKGNYSTSRYSQRIGIVGQVGRWKGHEELLQALRVVLMKLPESELHIFGRGEPDYEAHLRRQVAHLSLEKNVVWHGFVESLEEIYSEIDVLVIPSRCEESFGLTALEASFFQIPVIASRLGGLPEVIADSTTGFLYEPGNNGQFAQKLLVLLSNTRLRRKMGETARQRATSLFSRERFVQEFRKLLDSKLE